MNEILKKRIEEEAMESRRETARSLTHFEMQTSIDDAVAETAFEKGAEFALSHQWISVEEALPERGYEVLVLDKRHETQIAVYIGLEWWHNPIGYEKVYPTHWMPIPELNKK